MGGFGPEICGETMGKPIIPIKFSGPGGERNVDDGLAARARCFADLRALGQRESPGAFDTLAALAGKITRRRGARQLALLVRQASGALYALACLACVVLFCWSLCVPQCAVLLDGTDRDDLEVELSICPLRIDPNLCDRALCLAARANLRVLRRAENTQDV